MKAYPIYSILLFFLFLIPFQCCAFDSWEHKRIGDMAFHIAKTLYCDQADENLQNGRKATCDKLDAFADPFDPPLLSKDVVDVNAGPQDAEALTYGDIISCVDYFMTPEKLLAGGDDDVKRQSKGDADFPQNDVLPENMSQLHVKKKDCSDGSYATNWDYLQAMHTNHAHFQAELVISQRLYHSLAVEIAEHDHWIFPAMLVNAVSDHYLQDFFAPGHIRTARSHITDLFANAVHDEANRRGLILEVPREHMVMLADEAIKQYETLHDRSRIDNFAFVSGFMLVPGEGAVIREHFDITCRSSRCKGVSPHWPELNHEGFAMELEALKKIMLHWGRCENTSKSVCSFKVMGDARLWELDQIGQRAMILFINIRSIEDVLNSVQDDSNHDQIVNSFEHSHWFAWHQDSHQLFEPNALQTQAFIAQDVGYRTSTALNSSETPDFNNSLPPVYQAVVGISTRYDTMHFGQDPVRFSLGVETVPLGIVFPQREDWNVGLAIGYQLDTESYDKGHGWTIRPGAILPNAEATLSVPCENLSHHDQTLGQVHRWSCGLRIEHGGSSFMLFNLQISRDWAAQENGRLARGLSFGAGIELAAPRCRTPKFGLLCN